MDLTAIRTVVKGNALFKDLDQTDLDIIIGKAGARRFSPGDTIYRKGEEAGGTIGLIVSGVIHVLAANGYVLTELGTGEIIGEVGTISREGKRTVTLTVVEPAEIIEWHIEDLEGASPELIKRLKDLAWKRLKYYNE